MAKQSFTVGQVLTASQLTSLQSTALGGGAASAKTASYTLVSADAGTTISVTSTSATSITVNTGLFAAGDTVFIQNLGTGVSTITPGTATVNTSSSLALAQYEGGTLFFTSASASLFFKADGAAAASASGLTLIASPTSFTTSSAVNVDGVFSATYENYLILLNLDSASLDDYTNFRVRVGGSDETGSVYNWSLMANSAGNSAFDGGAGATQSSYRLSYIAAAGQGASMVINVNRPFLTKATNLNVSSVANFSTSNTFQLKSGGSVGNTTSYTAFTIFPASGTITGKVAVYGYSI